MNPETVTVTFADINYTIRYKWYMSNFCVISIDPKPAQHIYNIIKTKAMDKAIEAEYDAWIADHELDSLDETFDEGWTLLGHHNTGSGAKKFLDNH